MIQRSFHQNYHMVDDKMNQFWYVAYEFVNSFWLLVFSQVSQNFMNNFNVINLLLPLISKLHKLGIPFCEFSIQVVWSKQEKAYF